MLFNKVVKDPTRPDGAMLGMAPSVAFTVSVVAASPAAVEMGVVLSRRSAAAVGVNDLEVVVPTSR